MKGEDAISNSQYMDLLVFVPTESLAKYQAAEVWKDFWHIVVGAEYFTTAGISEVKANDAGKSMSVYDLQGRKLKTPQYGLNIINGKIFVK